jgi:hypothetical protein
MYSKTDHMAGCCARGLRGSYGNMICSLRQQGNLRLYVADFSPAGRKIGNN